MAESDAEKFDRIKKQINDAKNISEAFEAYSAAVDLGSVPLVELSIEKAQVFTPKGLGIVKDP